jgi:hypothetical protein
LHTNNCGPAQLLEQLDTLVIDESQERRFNVFRRKAANDAFRFDQKLHTRLATVDVKGDLWLTYGVQTNFGLLGLLLGRFKRSQSYPKAAILSFAQEFLRLALKFDPLPNGLSPTVPTQRTARLGLLHRLCCHSSRAETDLWGQMLRFAVKDLPYVSNGEPAARPESKVEEVVEVLHALVPLMHNEAYQDRYEIGYNQAHFVSASSVRGSKSVSPSTYWSLMGEAIGKRLLDQFVVK